MTIERRLNWIEQTQGAFATADSSRRYILGVGHNSHKIWIYPLYTPNGLQVLQEYPFDHPFHNGCFIGFSPIRVGSELFDFWSTPPELLESHFAHNGFGRQRVVNATFLERDCECLEANLSISWETCSGKELLSEKRRLRVTVIGNKHIVHLRSDITSSVDRIDIPATKFGGIGIRVDPRLTEASGARFTNISGEGTPSTLHNQSSPFIQLETNLSGYNFGLRIESPKLMRWFVRGYGLIVANPVWHSNQSLMAGEQFSQTITLTAYDGRFADNQADDRVSLNSL